MFILSENVTVVVLGSAMPHSPSKESWKAASRSFFDSDASFQRFFLFGGGGAAFTLSPRPLPPRELPRPLPRPRWPRPRDPYERSTSPVLFAIRFL